MGLFLLGVPMALMSLKMTHNEIKQAHNDTMVKNAPVSISEQKKEIDLHFKNILIMCKASCNIKQVYDNTYNYYDEKMDKILIYNIQCGRYGQMEEYLFRKGYSIEAINYCKEKFDKLGKQEQQKQNNNIQQAIQKYENAMKTKQCRPVRVTNKVHYPFSRYEVVQNCNTIESYLNSKGHNTQCNIVYENDKPSINHTETWLIQQPNGFNATQYYLNVCHKLEIKR